MSAEFVEYHAESPDCLWVVLMNGTADFREPAAMQELQGLYAELAKYPTPKVVIDLSLLPYFGSTVLEWLVSFWKKLRDRQGAMVLFGPTPIGRDVLKVVRFDAIWPIAETREEALQLLHTSEAS
jgi:anti-anti-sigma factor